MANVLSGFDFVSPCLCVSPVDMPFGWLAPEYTRLTKQEETEITEGGPLGARMAAVGASRNALEAEEEYQVAFYMG